VYGDEMTADVNAAKEWHKEKLKCFEGVSP
jgi:hypothetical protein